MSDMRLEQRDHLGVSFARLVDSPIRGCSPFDHPSMSRSESPQMRRLGGPSKEQGTYQSSPRATICEHEDDTLSIATHGRSQSRAETVRKEDDDEMAMAELRRLASEHRIPFLPHEQDRGLIAVHTEIEVTREERGGRILMDV